MCCPCFLNPCSPQSRKDYISLAKTFTFLVVVIEVVVMIVELGMGGFASPKENPMFGPPTATLLTLGGMNVRLIQSGEFWRLMTPVFLHAGIIHLLMNLVAQLRFGLFLERQWNIFRFIPVFLVSGIGGCILSALWNLSHPETVSVGASGAIMGLMGAFIAELAITWTTLNPSYRKQMAIQVAIWLVVIFLFGFSGSVDNAGHLGGLGTGLFFGGILFSYRHPNQIARLAILFISFMILSGFFVVSILKIFRIVP
jgi:membrane associated rhomboid family serine protease